MISIAIVDDEKVIREQIKKLIEKKQTDCVIDTYPAGEDLLQSDKCYDIVFLDIQMEGMNGIDTARVLRQKADRTVLIFIIGVKEYVFDAFDVAAFHYLIKPIEEQKFWEVYDRADLEVSKRKKQDSNPLFIKTRNRNVTLEQRDILYIESRAKKVEIHTKTDIVEAYAAISELEKQLMGKWFGKNGKYLLIAAFVVADYVLDYCFQSGYETKETLGKLLLLSAAVFVFAKLFYHAGTQMVGFLTITFIAIRDLCSFVGMIVVVCGGKLFDIWVLLLQKEYVSVGTMEYLIDGTASLLQTLMVACYMVLFYRSLKAVVKYYKDKEYQIHREELLFLLTPGCVGFLLCVMLRTILLTIENGVPQGLYEKHPVLMLVVPAILILALLSIIYSVKLFQDMITLNKEKSDKLILEKQIKNMQEHMAEMEHIYGGVRSMRHDMKNTLSVIMQLAVNEEGHSNEELQNYLSELNRTMDRLDFQYKTGNSVVDILLNMKYHELTCTMPDIQLNADRLLFPENLQIQSYDIGIIIGNALDNAIEACKKLKDKEQSADAFITLSSFARGKMFFVEVENSFDGKLIRKNHSEFPVTDKKDKKAHGIGLSNIKNTAEKYHGGVDWTVENKKFTLTVMLQNEKQQ